MAVKNLFEFEKGEVVPAWLYLVRDEIASVDVSCSFDTSGRCALMGDESLMLWPGANRKPEEYVFVFENKYYANASAGHPAGDELLTVLPSEAAARELLGLRIDDPAEALPGSDPRN